jgi:hypothetical protein
MFRRASGCSSTSSSGIRRQKEFENQHLAISPSHLATQAKS